MAREFTQEQLRSERDKHKSWLSQEPGVMGTSIGIGRDGKACIRVLSNRIPAARQNEILQRFGSAPVEIVETGEIVASNGS